jgi:hypothetical protein
MPGHPVLQCVTRASYCTNCTLCVCSGAAARRGGRGNSSSNKQRYTTSRGAPYHVDLRKQAEKRVMRLLATKQVSDAVAGGHMLLLTTAREDFTAAKVSILLT